MLNWFMWNNNSEPCAAYNQCLYASYNYHVFDTFDFNTYISIPRKFTASLTPHGIIGFLIIQDELPILGISSPQINRLLWMCSFIWINALRKLARLSSAAFQYGARYTLSKSLVKINVNHILWDTRNVVVRIWYNNKGHPSVLGVITMELLNSLTFWNITDN